MAHKFGFFFIAMLLLLNLPLGADNRHQFTVYNRGYHAVWNVWIVDYGAPDWGDDLLQNDQIISVGHQFTWELESACDQSVAIRFADGHERFWRPIDTCANDIYTTH